MTDPRNGETPELKSCPFCGISARLVHWKNYKDEPAGCSVKCAYENCLVAPSTGNYDDEIDAINSWNTRADLARPPAPDDIDGVHSKIDMDIEDAIGRELSLEESKIVGLAIRAALLAESQPPSEAERELAQLKAALVPLVEALKKAHRSFVVGATPIQNAKVNGWNECIDYLAANGHLTRQGGSAEPVAWQVMLSDVYGCSRTYETKEQCEIWANDTWGNPENAPIRPLYDCPPAAPAIGREDLERVRRMLDAIRRSGFKSYSGSEPHKITVEALAILDAALAGQAQP